MKAICLPRRNRSSNGAFCSSRMTYSLNWEFWMILFRADPIFASSISKFGKSFPYTYREDFSSSKEPTSPLLWSITKLPRFSLNFCIENSSTCCTCALFIFPFSCLLRICVSQRAFAFRNNSSCNQFVLDEIQQILCARPVVPCFAPPFVCVNHRCTHWVTRHEVLFWKDLILPDSASDLHCLRAEFHSNSTDWRFRTENSTFGFSVPYSQVKKMQPVSRKLYDLLMNETFVHLPLFPERPLHLVSQKLFGHTVVNSATFVTLHLRDQSPQCFP